MLRSSLVCVSVVVMSVVLVTGCSSGRGAAWKACNDLQTWENTATSGLLYKSSVVTKIEADGQSSPQFEAAFTKWMTDSGPSAPYGTEPGADMQQVEAVCTSNGVPGAIPSYTP
jgi:hypothetical protein